MRTGRRGNGRKQMEGERETQQQRRRRRMEVCNFITTGTRVPGPIVPLMLSGTVTLEEFEPIATTRLSGAMVTGYSSGSRTH